MNILVGLLVSLGGNSYSPLQMAEQAPTGDGVHRVGRIT